MLCARLCAHDTVCQVVRTKLTGILQHGHPEPKMGTGTSTLSTTVLSESRLIWQIWQRSTHHSFLQQRLVQNHSSKQQCSHSGEEFGRGVAQQRPYPSSAWHSQHQPKWQALL